MQFRNLGRTGLKVSALCLGTMQFGWTADAATSLEVITAAWNAGINFIDTADVYSRWAAGNPGGVAETIVGEWIKSRGISRHQLVLATKVRGKMGDGPNDEGLSRVHILKAVEESLHRLQTDYIDLYQVHFPDENTPVEETLSTMNDLVRQGKVRYIGCSNFPAWRLVHALWVSDRSGLARFDCLQPHYNLVHRAEFERELRTVCQVFGLGVIPYSPLAGGFLTGKYTRSAAPADSHRKERASRYYTERNWELLDLLGSIAAQHAPATLSQVALGWMMADPLITSPIIGPRSVNQLEDNLGALALSLNREEIDQLNQASAWDR
jgi:aryl-alcohol dehydrogenase-like predicted oxidoreductase